MFIVKLTSAFKKNYKLMKKRGKNMSLLDNVIDTLRNGGTLDQKLQDHELKGQLKGFRECNIQPGWLLVYSIQNDVLKLTLVGTGSHSYLFKM